MDEILDYEGMLYSIISKYPKRYDKDDLYQVAMLGLIDAHKHYDESFNTKFSTYAYYYIVGEVNKYIRESSSLKVSRNLIDLNKKVIKTKELMSQKLGRDPTNLEISLYLEVDEEVINNAIIACSEVSQIENEDINSYDNITSSTILDLREEIKKLPKTEKNLIMARYYDELTQSETSKILGISQVQVSRSEKKVLQKLKSNLS